MNEEYPPMCCVCGFPDNACKLVRITWEEVEGRMMPVMFLAKDPKPNDVLVCGNCIHGIKGLPNSEVPAAIE